MLVFFAAANSLQRDDTSLTSCATDSVRDAFATVSLWMVSLLSAPDVARFAMASSACTYAVDSASNAVSVTLLA